MIFSAGGARRKLLLCKRMLLPVYNLLKITWTSQPAVGQDRFKITDYTKENDIVLNEKGYLWKIPT